MWGTLYEMLRPVPVSSLSARWALDVVDAAYRMAPTATDWLRGVVGAARPALEADLGLTGSTFAWRDGELHFDAMVHVGDLPQASRNTFLQGASHLSPQEQRVAYGPGLRALEASSDLMSRRRPAPERDHATEELRSMGIRDFLGAGGLDPSGCGYVLAAPLSRRASVPRRQRAVWGRLRAHLLAGLRLHSGNTEIDAVLLPGGEVIHAGGAAKSIPAREALRAAAVRIDRARSRRGRSNPEAALVDWEGLVSGRWSLLDRFDADGRRYLIARRNDPALPSPRPLSRRERQVLAYAALGRSNKEIAYELGIAPSTVSTCLSSAMQRLRIRSHAQLTDLWWSLGGREAQQ
jgi:DNA-binding CsgD family transcriptional regulator